MNADRYTLLNTAMWRLAALPNAIFVGQSVRFGGTAMYRDLEGISDSQRLEFPVAEDLQLGFCTGLSLQGFLPICIFPRMDFLLRAADQLVSHLDKLELMSRGQFRPRVIIRTAVGSKTPLDAGPQHTQDHTLAFQALLEHVRVRKIYRPEAILGVYAEAAASADPYLIVEAL